MTQTYLVTKEDLMQSYSYIRNCLDDPRDLDKAFTLFLNAVNSYESDSYQVLEQETSIRHWLNVAGACIEKLETTKELVYRENTSEILDDAHCELMDWYNYTNTTLRERLEKDCLLGLANKECREVEHIQQVAIILIELDEDLEGQLIEPREASPIIDFLTKGLKKLRYPGTHRETTDGDVKLCIKKLKKSCNGALNLKEDLKELQKIQEITKLRKSTISANTTTSIHLNNTEFTPVSTKAIEEVRLASIPESVDISYNFVDREKLLQQSLRHSVYEALGITEVDNGKEYKCSTGYIDIFGEDDDGHLTVVEIKKDEANDAAVGQLLGYMNSIADENNRCHVRGILVAAKFTDRVKEAAQAANIDLVLYEPLVRIKKFES